MRSAKRAAVERSCVIMRMPSPRAAQVVEDAEDPGPHGHVEHRDGLVGDEEVGVEDEARGDGDALPLAAGELVRIAVEEELGRVEARRAEGLLDLAPPLLLRADPVHHERLLDASLRTRKRGSSDSYGSW